jgi:hypothetical protein
MEESTKKNSPHGTEAVVAPPAADREEQLGGEPAAASDALCARAAAGARSGVRRHLRAARRRALFALRRRHRDV